jgi:hypothetical protein
MRTLKSAVVWAILAAASAAAQNYVGAGGCASSNCHGGTTELPEAQSRILGNEFATWSVSDRHAQAYRVLLEPRGRRMAELLKIQDATRDRRCASCHVAGSPEKSLSDGVACEACHGPALQWLGPHTQQNSHAENLKHGMIDTRDLGTRVNTCIACHVGSGEQVVDHEMIAAGHPDLAFEWGAFSFAQPAHYRAPKPAQGDTLPAVRIWAVGQSSALAAGARLLASHTARNWPEFSDLECYQCHHDLRLESWRIQRGYAGRTPGSLRVNLARFAVLRAVEPALDAPLSRVEAAVASKPFDGTAITQAAKAVEQASDALMAGFAAQNFDAARTREILGAIESEIQRIADSGPNAAEQATMSLDTLITALTPGPRRPAVRDLYTYLEHPSTYRPSEFVALFRKAVSAR